MPNPIPPRERTPHDLSHFLFTCGKIGRLQTLAWHPVVAGDSYELDMVGSLRLSPLIRGLILDSKVDICTFYVPHRHSYKTALQDPWSSFMETGFNAESLSATEVNNGTTINEESDLNFLGATNEPTQNTVPTWLPNAYYSIWNNYFKRPLAPDRTYTVFSGSARETSKYGESCQHLKRQWTAPLSENYAEDNDNVSVDGDSINLKALNQAYAQLHTDQERELFMQRYRDVMESFGGSASTDADDRPTMLMRTEFWASGYDVDGTDQSSLGQYTGKVQQAFQHSAPRFFCREHGVIMTVALVRFPPVHFTENHYLLRNPEHTYAEIAADPIVVANNGAMDVDFSNFIIGEDGDLKVPYAFWYREHFNFVHSDYQALGGYPFLSTTGLSLLNGYIAPQAYDDMFQNMQLAHWNCQAKANVRILRNLPNVRDTVLTSAS